MRAGETFTKRSHGVAGLDLRLEAKSLTWLAEAEAAGGMRVAHVLSVTSDELVEERAGSGGPSRAGAEKIGRALAHTHAAGAPWYGCPPAGWDLTQGQGHVIAHSLTPLVDEGDASDSWGAYFAEWRIRAYMRQALKVGAFGTSEAQLMERVAARLEDGVYDSPQPELVGEGPARLHGDLWSGNVLWDGDSPTGAVLIDPMAHGGHAETDLAMLALFGYPYLDVVLDAYDEVSPLADGWRERVGLHQLAPLLHHCVLFGGGYVSQTLAMARRYA